MTARLPAQTCFHCGLPVPSGSAWSVLVDGARQPMCCPGCEAVAAAIFASGCGDYYRTRSSYAAPAPAEAPAAPERAPTDAADAGVACFSVEGIRCAACVWLIERRLRGLPGVRAADLNVATGRLQVAWQGGGCGRGAIVAELRAVGYTAYSFDPLRQGEQLERERKLMFRRLFVAGLSMMQVMMYALPVYLAGDGTMDADMTALMQWASLLLTLPALVYSAQPFWRGAWLGVRQGMPGMDLPVAIGIGAAFAGSVAALLRGGGDVYFDSITMFVFLLLASRYLELSARRGAARALEGLRRALPSAAARVADDAGRATELVDPARLRAGDLILVRPGEALAADAVIVEGASEVDLSLLTGESRAQARAAGDALPGGAVNLGQPLLLRVTRPAGESTLALLVRLAEGAGAARPRIAQWADRVARWFVLALLLAAALAFFAWQWIDPARAWQVAVAMLVVSCPCALSLATPAALAAATDRLLRGGVLVIQPHVLETLQRATHVVFDKTGTLTCGRPVLREVRVLGAATRGHCIAVAAALEQSSSHPLGAALRAAAAGGSLAPAGALRHVAGQGIEGEVAGVRYRLGSAAFAGAVADADDGETTLVYLAGPDGLLARFALADAVRPEARDVVDRLRRSGAEVILLSGDAQPVADRVAAELGIGRALGGQLPEQKLAFVRALQAEGAVVAMVGDGVNDAPVLRAADVSFAMGGGSDLARVHADCVLLSDSLAGLGECAAGAARTVAVIRQNLGWAMLYNLLAIPAAACGLLDPWMTAAGMSASSALVVLNALRLRGAGRG